MQKQKVLLSFDLDYTLIDNTEGIVNSFKYALEKSNVSLISDDSIKSMIGIPLETMFKKVTTEDPSHLSMLFRKYYATSGMYQVKLLPNAYSTINLLCNEFELGVITSKKQTLAKKLLDHLGLSKFFQFVVGENEQIKRKDDPNLKNFLMYNFPNYWFIFIGDHISDRRLAEMMNSPFIGVLTGFHSRSDLVDNIKVKYEILNSVNELTKDIVLNLIKK